MNLNLYLDSANRRFVRSLTDSSAPTLPSFVQGDICNIFLYGVEQIPEDLASDRLFNTVSIPFTTIKLALGHIDEAPTSGTFKIGIAADDTTAVINYNDTKAQIQNKVNAWLGGSNIATVVQTGVNNILQIYWNDPDAHVGDDFAFYEVKLSPKCKTVVKTMETDELGTVYILKYHTYPVAFTQDFAPQIPAAPTITQAKAGSGTQNEVQQYKFDVNSASTMALKFGGASTIVLPVSISAASLQSALNNLYTDGTQRFKVSNFRRGVHNIEFIGPLAQADQALIVVDIVEHVPFPYCKGTLELTGAALELAINGQPSLSVLMELEVTDGSEVTTPIQMQATILNDMIEGISVFTDPDWIDQISDPVGYVTYDHESVFSGTRSYATVLSTSATTYSINHGFNTKNVHVTVRDTNDGGHRKPDNEYTVTYVDNNNIQITFPSAPAINQYAVILTDAESEEHFLGHTHTSDQIEHDGQSLEEILNALSLLDGGFTSEDILNLWPAIPLNKIPQLDWGKLRGSGASGSDTGPTLPVDMLTPGVIRSDANGYIPIANIPPSVPRVDESGNLTVTVTQADGTQVPLSIMNVITNTFSQDLITGVITQMITVQEFRTAVLTALQQGAMPEGVVPFIISDIDWKFPEGPLPYALRAAVGVSEITGYLPRANAANKDKFYIVVDHAYAAPNRRKTFRDGVKVYSNGFDWYEADVAENFTSTAATVTTYKTNKLLASADVSGSILAGSLVRVDGTDYIATSVVSNSVFTRALPSYMGDVSNANIDSTVTTNITWSSSTKKIHIVTMGDGTDNYSYILYDAAGTEVSADTVSSLTLNLATLGSVHSGTVTLPSSVKGTGIVTTTEIQFAPSIVTLSSTPSEDPSGFNIEAIDATFYPKEMERELFTLHVNSAMFQNLTQFIASFAFTLQLQGNCEGRYLFELLVGAPTSVSGAGNIQGISFSSTPISQEIVVSDTAITHPFRFNSSKDDSGVITTTKTIYTKETAATATASSFVLRGRLTKWDVENTAETPKGTLSLKMKGATATLADVE